MVITTCHSECSSQNATTKYFVIARQAKTTQVTFRSTNCHEMVHLFERRWMKPARLYGIGVLA
jgi:hypothetical protein